MQAITTKYLAATNTKGGRIKATADAGSITIHWDHTLNQDDNHKAAAKALRSKLGWIGPHYGPMHMGVLSGSKGGCVFVFVTHCSEVK